MNKVDIHSNHTEVVCTFTIPHLDKQVQLFPRGLKAIIIPWIDFIVLAIEARMDACVFNMINHKDSIVKSDQHQIVYTTSTGKAKFFNHESFMLMQDLIDRLKSHNIDTISFPQWRQALLALYWVDKPEEEPGDVSFAELVSAIMEAMLQKARFE